MRKLADKGLLLGCCVTLLAASGEAALAGVLVMLGAVLLSALCQYIGGRFVPAACLAALAVSFFVPECLFFLPLAVYECIGTRIKALCGLWVIPLLFHLAGMPAAQVLTVLTFCGLSAVLRVHTDEIARYRSSYRDLQDSAREMHLHLEEKNRELMDKQDYEVHLATLGERNRIAREIHDNVGHQLSRSLLQVGALLVVNKDETVKSGLETVKTTLSDAMDSIRRSVHRLHDESIDVQSQLETLIREFTFCPVTLDYDAGDMDKGLKYAVIAIVREALSNVIKHSDATAVSVTVREHPALYQLIIQDNGTKSRAPDGQGIGLRNMADRVEAFHGTFHIERKKGFKLFISIPKEGGKHERIAGG